jgi:hypothetical protein
MGELNSFRCFKRSHKNRFTYQPVQNMKVSILSTFILFCFVHIAFGQETGELDLLKPTENFRLDSLDKIIKTVPASPGFITINVWARTDSATVSAYGKEFYLLRVLTVDEKRFSAIIYK